MTTPGGQQLPSGLYQHSAGEFVRIGDTPELTRWHGTAQPEGTTISEFEPSEGDPQGEYNAPILGRTPAVFVTEDQDRAADYALHAEYVLMDPDIKGQIYELKIRPDVVIDLDRCEDDGVIRRALRLDPDVIECPKFPEQPETVVLNPSIIEIVNAYKLDKVNPRLGRVGDKIENGNSTLDYRFLDAKRKTRGLPPANRARGGMYMKR